MVVPRPPSIHPAEFAWAATAPNFHQFPLNCRVYLQNRKIPSFVFHIYRWFIVSGFAWRKRVVDGVRNSRSKEGSGSTSRSTWMKCTLWRESKLRGATTEGGVKSMQRNIRWNIGDPVSTSGRSTNAGTEDR